MGCYRLKEEEEDVPFSTGDEFSDALPVGLSSEDANPGRIIHSLKQFVNVSYIINFL